MPRIQAATVEIQVSFAAKETIEYAIEEQAVTVPAAIAQDRDALADWLDRHESTWGDQINRQDAYCSGRTIAAVRVVG